MLKNENTRKHAETKTDKNALKKLKNTAKNGIRKKLDAIPTHPNKYTGSELFCENLTQYSIPTLIGVQHYIYWQFIVHWQLIADHEHWLLMIDW